MTGTALYERLLIEQRKWIEECGGDLAGYRAKASPLRTPENVEAIYRADLAELERIETRLQGYRR